MNDRTAEIINTILKPAVGAVKHDDEKTPYALLDPLYLELTAKVLQFGAKKYAAWNWAKGMDWSRVYSALQRHLNAYWGGEELDPETGLPHLACASCCLMFLMRYQSNALGTDDRHQFGAPLTHPGKEAPDANG
jgi:hypothetical protein